MNAHIKEKNLSEQPISKIMVENELKPSDLVAHSDEQITHKMVTRVMKGRRLTPHVKLKVRNALNNVLKKDYLLKDLFSY